MLFEQALQIVDSIIQQVSMPRQGHFEAQQAIAALQEHYKKALDEVELLQAAKEQPPKHRD